MSPGCVLLDLITSLPSSHQVPRACGTLGERCLAFWVLFLKEPLDDLLSAASQGGLKLVDRKNQREITEQMGSVPQSWLRMIDQVTTPKRGQRESDD